MRHPHQPSRGARLTAGLLLSLTSLIAARADTAFGTLSNFDVINDTGQTCYGFEIELEDVRSASVGYTYDWNHYGTPVISEDLSDSLHPKVRIRYGGKKNTDGSFIGFTNPQDPNNPLRPTDGHACTNPGVNLGCEHFGVGYYGAPSAIRYFWLVEDPFQPGTLIRGPIVTLAMPQFSYLPPAPPQGGVGNPAAPARVAAVIEPPEIEEEEVEGQFGVPVWVKILKTVQRSGKKVRLDELVSDDETRDDDVNWAGEEEVETEIEWSVFQKRPPGELEDEGDDDIGGEDELPEGDETVTRRYEFYKYEGPLNPEDGEAECDDPEECPDAIGAYIGSQMAGFNVEAPLGLIDHLQDGELHQPYVDRLMVIGGNTPYTIHITDGALPNGLEIDPDLGLLTGIPTSAGVHSFTLEVTDADEVRVSQTYTFSILAPFILLTDALPAAQVGTPYGFQLTASGGTPPYQWSASNLPSGLDVDSSGHLSGIPDLGSAGDYLPTFTALDDAGQTLEQSLALEVAPALPIPGDADGDSDIDRDDLNRVLAARNQPASGPDDPRDLDHDGRITVLDARILVTRYTRPGGALR